MASERTCRCAEQKTIATISASAVGGDSGDTAKTACSSASTIPSHVPTARDSAPPPAEVAVFPIFSALCSSPVPPSRINV